jgi:nitrate reductase gamma subunit
MTSMEFLLWVRGPAFQIAVAVFVLGVAVRLLEIYLLGRTPDLAVPRAGSWLPGLRTIYRRSFSDGGTFRREPITMVAGYAFHLGLFITLLLFAPHIELFHEWWGLRWPALPTPVVDAAAVVTIVALLILLLTRLWDRVRRYISQTGDYLVWTVTLLPVLTGYLAYHRLLLPYQNMLALHILSVEALLLVFPFTKLMHTFTIFGARWYNGALAGRRGVTS